MCCGFVLILFYFSSRYWYWPHWTFLDSPQEEMSREMSLMGPRFSRLAGIFDGPGNWSQWPSGCLVIYSTEDFDTIKSVLVNVCSINSLFSCIEMISKIVYTVSIAVKLLSTNWTYCSWLMIVETRIMTHSKGLI